jgi:magnesium chelatase family protein
MMAVLATAISAAVLGVEAYEVLVEVDIARGLPTLLIVGLPDAAVQESRERVRAAINNAGLPFPTSRIIINLAPAHIKKEGPAFDLPIALALLAAQGIIPEQALAGTVASGELALNGALRPVRGAINIGLFATQQRYRRLLIPPANASEVALAQNKTLTALAPQTLNQAVSYLQGSLELPPVLPASSQPAQSTLDLVDIKGQAGAKRALEITATGSHNLLMKGPPGSGKTMLAQRLPSILPKLGQQEAIEVTRIHSSAGILKQSGLITHPPFRSPHHTISDAGLIGGGTIPRPGEVSLAHNGVLFLDEIPEFNRRALEVMRQPLEDGVVTISRARAVLTFPARFMLIASQNPCPCGFYGDSDHLCSCTPLMRQRYGARLSGPLLDRIDLRIRVPQLSAEELLDIPPGESSKQLGQRIATARTLAVQRQGRPNAQLTGQALQRHAYLKPGPQAFAKNITKQLWLSGRGFDRLLRVARTIADLAGEDFIDETHLAEASSYR